MRRVFTRRAFVRLGSAVAASLGLAMAGCSAPQGAQPQDRSVSAGFITQPEDRDPMGSTESTTVRVGLIMGPPSMGLTQFLLAARNGRTTNDFQFTFNGVDYIGLSAALNNGDYDVATLPSNIGPTLYNNKELHNQYEVISINNLGVLYVMTTDESIRALSDLAGRHVYSYGEGGTPSTPSRRC